MGELLRSQEMELVQIYMEMEAAHDTVDELGRLGLVQFRDVCCCWSHPLPPGAMILTW
jgi:hypothetical protein